MSSGHFVIVPPTAASASSCSNSFTNQQRLPAPGCCKGKPAWVLPPNLLPPPPPPVPSIAHPAHPLPPERDRATTEHRSGPRWAIYNPQHLLCPLRDGDWLPWVERGHEPCASAVADTNPPPVASSQPSLGCRFTQGRTRLPPVLSASNTSNVLLIPGEIGEALV